MMQPTSTTSKSSREPSQQAKDNLTVTKRLQGELRRLMLTNLSGISAFPEQSNLFKWIGTIVGPDGTVYEKLTFKLLLEFSNEYPYKAPNVKFITPCFHPNVDFISGSICLDILKEKWSALYDVQSILMSIQSLLNEPNNRSPLNAQAAKIWSNKEAFKIALKESYNTSKKTDKEGDSTTPEPQ